MGAAMTAETLEDALQRCREGDPDAFGVVYRHVGRTLYGTALRMLRSPEDAEEAMQDTFVRFCRSVPEMPAAQVPAWLHRVLVNTCIDRLRHRRRWGRRPIDERTRPAPLAPDGLGLDLRRAVGKLPRRAREVFLLHDVEGFKHKEIGEMLGVSVGASKSQLFRAREILRARMSAAGRAES